MSAPKSSRPKPFANASSIFDLGGRRHALERHVEDRRFSGEVRHAVILWKRYRDRPAFAGLHAVDLSLEAGDERARAEHEVDIFASSAFERHAVDFAEKVQGHLVAVSGGRLAVLGGIGAILLDEPRQDLIDIGVGHVGDKPFDLDILETGDLDLR